MDDPKHEYIYSSIYMATYMYYGILPNEFVRTCEKYIGGGGKLWAESLRRVQHIAGGRAGQGRIRRRAIFATIWPYMGRGVSQRWEEESSSLRG